MKSRPLTNVPSEINHPLPLKPNHFLLTRASVNYRPGLFEKQKVAESKLWKSAQELASHSWIDFFANTSLINRQGQKGPKPQVK